MRQGNDKSTAEILCYGVDRSFDANAYQRPDTKERFIKSIMNGSNTDPEAEHVVRRRICGHQRHSPGPRTLRRGGED